MPCSICHLAGHNRTTCPQRPVPMTMPMPTQPSIVALAAGFEARRAERWTRDDIRSEERAARIAIIVGSEATYIDASDIHAARAAAATIESSARVRVRAQQLIRIRDAVISTRHQLHPPPPPTPVKIHEKIPIPKHISTQIWKHGHPDCMICLSPTTEENFTLSKCGHEYCSTCFSDVRLLKCGACRQDL